LSREKRLCFAQPFFSAQKIVKIPFLWYYRRKLAGNEGASRPFFPGRESSGLVKPDPGSAPKITPEPLAEAAVEPAGTSPLTERLTSSWSVYPGAGVM
jgi:hypothetical protein